MATITESDRLTSAQQLGDQIKALGDGTGEQLRILFEEYRAGTLSLNEFKQGAVALLQQSNSRAAALAFADVFEEYVELYGSLPDVDPVLRLDQALDSRRLTQSVATSIAEGEDEFKAMRLERLARGEATDSAKSARSSAIEASGAKGWKRGLEAKACQLCQWWEREGRVWPVDHNMPTHTGCLCQQIPVYKTKFTPVLSRRHERRLGISAPRDISE